MILTVGKYFWQVSLIATLLHSTQTKIAKHLINLCMNQRSFFYKGLRNKLSTLKYWNGLRLAMESQFRSTWFRKGIDLVGMYLACYFGIWFTTWIFLLSLLYSPKLLFFNQMMESFAGFWMPAAAEWAIRSAVLRGFLTNI